MSRLVGFLVAVAAAAVMPVANAGVAPTHDVSQLSQSGAKIAPPRKAEEETEEVRGAGAAQGRQALSAGSKPALSA
jgi:hypothetical protein